MIYITSDLHFGHNKEFLYKPRGFTNIYDHDATIIKNWDSLVKADDDVYVLGDLVLDDLEYGLSCIKQLTGRIHIIIGNHDTDTKVEAYKTLYNVAEVIGYSTILKYNKFRFYLSHYPTKTSNFDEDKPLRNRLINLCGHSHTSNRLADKEFGLCYHCELDAHDNRPISLDYIIEDLKGALC